MTLHLDQIMDDVEQLGRRLGASERRQWLDDARRLLRECDADRLESRLARNALAQRPLLAPQPLGPLEERRPAPAHPASYATVAVDGSTIAPDRGMPARYFVLNLGAVRLAYGRRPQAVIDARAQLYHRPEELYWDERRQVPVDEGRLALLMRIEEIAALPDLVEQCDEPCVALVDGQLVLWALQQERSAQKPRLLARLHEALDRLRDLETPVAGYISNTSSFELVNALRIYLCPTSPDQCRQCHARGAAEVELCYHLNDFRDPALLFDFLEAGERSCCFASRAEILNSYAPEHRIVFFFMSTGDEIARVEVPAWVAERPDLLDRVQAVLADQCHRSGILPPYPPVLHEAHEAAVISTRERELLQQLVSEQMEQMGAPRFRSAKEFHKRTRGV